MLIIIGTGILATNYGSTAAKILFYASIVVPLSALLYTFYVYRVFRVYNTIESKIVVKGDKIPYRFIIANENFIAFTSVKVRFAEGKSKIDDLDLTKDFCLLPGQKIDMNTYLTCLYRGEYKVGIDKVIVKDFLGLWEIAYSSQSTLSMRVCPRILKLTSLSFVPDETDIKVSSFISSHLDSDVDNDMRKYVNGDSRHLINWKASAKSGDLLVRKYMHVQKTRIAMFMDISALQSQSDSIYITEDRIIETAVALSDYFMRNGKPLSVITNDNSSFEINTKQDFEGFYSFCSTVSFRFKQSVAELLNRNSLNPCNLYIVVTSILTKELAAELYKAVTCSKDVVLILLDEVSTEIALDARITLINIEADEDIKRALTLAKRRSV